MIAEIGLIILCLAWLSQLIYSWKGKKEIQKKFVWMYILGVAFLVADGYIAGLYSLAILNIVALVIALIVAFRLQK